jgi:hypothetical protein
LIEKSKNMKRATCFMSQSQVPVQVTLEWLIARLKNVKASRLIV